MCTRYSITSSAEAIRRVFRVRWLPNLDPRYNVAPTQDVPVVRLRDDGNRELAMLRWGLIPPSPRNAAVGRQTINIHAENLAKNPSFRDAFARRRCLVVADGYYEWQTVGSAKHPWRITLSSGEPFGFAGLWERWKVSGGRTATMVTIITTEANPRIWPIHERMPVIVAPADHERWLGAARSAEVADLLRPYPSSKITAYRVSAAVDNEKNDVRECVARI